MQRHAFTLIELLIVVAIIAILAAIAVPNFLEAQTRSKVSRAKADMRTVTTAMECYRVDNNIYPWRSTAGEPNIQANWRFPYAGNYFITIDEALGLTTPVSYITSNQLRDPFITAEVEMQNVWYVNQLNAGGQVAQTKAFAIDRHTQNQRYPSFMTSVFQKAQDPGYGMLSTGPDRLYYDEAWGTQSWGIGAAHYTMYDPTNGTVSKGNIWRFAP